MAFIIDKPTVYGDAVRATYWRPKSHGVAQTFAGLYALGAADPFFAGAVDG